MTRELRAAHRRVWFVLPLAAAAILIAGVAARRTTTPENAQWQWEAAR